MATMCCLLLVVVLHVSAKLSVKSYSATPLRFFMICLVKLLYLCKHFKQGRKKKLKLFLKDTHKTTTIKMPIHHKFNLIIVFNSELGLKLWYVVSNVVIHCLVTCIPSSKAMDHTCLNRSNKPTKNFSLNVVNNRSCHPHKK